MSLFTVRAVVHLDVSALLARIVACSASSITNIKVACIAITNLKKRPKDDFKKIQSDKKNLTLPGWTALLRFIAESQVKHSN